MDKTLSVAAGHPIFAGHFPGRPIVPGVMLLEWVLAGIAQARHCPPSALRLREAKFFTPLGPAENAELRLELADSRCTFSIHREAVTIARGVVDWAADV
jgi:3-hydroxyacyl-[acyl-carrier-protein] dehydratase